MPSTTGLTNSRWLGFGASDERHLDQLAVAVRPARAPRWYFTSPVQPLSLAASDGAGRGVGVLASNSAMIAA